MIKQPSVTFGVGTGRCGTRFLAELMKQTKGVDAYHEQHPLSDAFLRYATWYQLPIDLSGCWSQKEEVVNLALMNSRHYVESSAYLSLNIQNLYQRFNARFILLVRHPKEVIHSFFAKGLYEQPVVRTQSNLPPSIQPHLKLAHHHFSRILAYGPEGESWNQLTRIGKLAWYWHLINSRVLQAFDQLPSTHRLVIRLEDFNYEKYLELCAFTQVVPTLKKRRFDKIRNSRPNRGKSNAPFPNWSDKALKEYQMYVNPLIGQFDYR